MFSKIDLGNVRGILLDLDNTLYAYSPCHQHALRCCYNEFITIKTGISFDEFSGYYQNAQKLVKEYLKEQGAGHSRFLYFQRLFERIFDRTEVDLTIRFEKLYWDSFFTEMVLFDGVVDFLKRCRLQGVKICLTTDLTAEIQFKKAKYLDIDQYIDWIVSSEEAGQEKPGGQIYKLALEKLNLLPQEVLMIGDDQAKDGEGAKRMNIKAVHLLAGEII